MTRTLEEQGFIKHDGGPMPNCYAPDDEVDFIRTEGPPVTWNASDMDNDYWSPRITHHRRHISERQQLDMAIEALRKIPFLSRTKEQADTLKSLRERQPS